MNIRSVMRHLSEFLFGGKTKYVPPIKKDSAILTDSQVEVVTVTPKIPRVILDPLGERWAKRVNPYDLNSVADARRRMGKSHSVNPKDINPYDCSERR